MQVLKGHNSPETAYLVVDYPYGFRLRCSIRYWIETTKHGQRMMSQTSNPKKPGMVWNKPKPSTYALIMVMYLDEKGHVEGARLSEYDHDEEKINAFIASYGEALSGDYETKRIEVMRATARAHKHITVDVISNPTPEQSAAIKANNARVAAMMPKMIAKELGEIRAAQ